MNITILFILLFSVVAIANIPNIYYLVKGKSYSSSSSSSSTTNETSKYTTPKQKRISQRLIRANGYTCDNVAHMRPLMFSAGYTVYCNDYRYVYEIEDVGGNLQVTVK